MLHRGALFAMLLALGFGCATGGAATGEDEDFSDPPVPEDAEIPEDADVPLLPPNEGDKDVISSTDDTGADDAGSAFVDAGASDDRPTVPAATDVPAPWTTDVPVPWTTDVPAPWTTDVPVPSFDAGTMVIPGACRWSVGPFTWSCAGPVSGVRCIALDEPLDPDGWANNHLCSRDDLGLRWSNAGPIAGMRCLRLEEPEEPASHGWNDNHLCVPAMSPVTLLWSHAGPIPGRECVPIYEPGDTNGWRDNYLCWVPWEPPPPASCAGSASGQSAIWTCTQDRRARQRCVRGVTETVVCPNGCVPQPSGTIDYCAPTTTSPTMQPACAQRPLLRAGLHPDASDRLRCAGVPAARITQTIGYYAASAGTHAPDGRANGQLYSAATDISTRNLSELQVRALLSRLADQGFAAWFRQPGADGWPRSEAPHIHAIYVGCAMKSALDAQVRDWLAGLNGLRSHARYTFLRWQPRQINLVRSLYDRFN